jgi:hypothetical protein
MASLYRDNNAQSVQAGFRPKAIAAGIISVTLSGTTQELTVPTITANQQGEGMVRVIAGTQGAYFAFNAASAGALHTGITNMIAIQANTFMDCKVRSTDVKVYVLQLGTAGTIQVVVLE